MTSDGCCCLQHWRQRPLLLLLLLMLLLPPTDSLCLYNHQFSNLSSSTLLRAAVRLPKGLDTRAAATSAQLFTQNHVTIFTPNPQPVTFSVNPTAPNPPRALPTATRGVGMSGLGL